VKYKSDAYEAIHEDAMADFEIGAISKERMREYDEMCLVQEPKPARKTEQVAEYQTPSVSDTLLLPSL
jgi:putative transcriptional regulator